MCRRILLACLLLLPIAPAEAKPPKAALKVLNLLKQVDGAGSGLDADTVRGVAPVVVRDAHGALVGTVLDQTDATLLNVVRGVGGMPVVFAVTADGFLDASAQSFFL